MPDQTNNSKSRKYKLFHGALTVVVAAAIFLFGWAIGSGRIAIGPGATYRRTENASLPSKLDFTTVNKLYSTLKSDYDGKLDQAKLIDGLRSGLAGAAGDPYTEYFNPTAAKQFNSDLNGTFTGIGAELSKDSSNNITVIAPISGFPADKAGLKPKDIIAQIDGKSATDLTVEEAVQKIRGPAGTNVTLTIVRGNNPSFDVTITRQNISIPSVTSKTLDGNIGYIKISRFGEDTVQLATSAASGFKDQHVKGVVLDLRSDPGGLLGAAVGVSGLWLPNGQTVLSERRDGKVTHTYLSEGPATLAGIPTVVLIDSGSASASEITAGALHDNKVATLVGVKSFGKGSVQQLEDLGDGSLLKVTIARWYTPAGKNIDKAGIQPDKPVTLSDDDAKNGRDPQLDAAITQLR